MNFLTASTRGARILLLTILVLLCLSAGSALAATATIRPDGVVSAGSWTGVTAANLNDASDATAASITGTVSTFTVSLANDPAYSGATISDVTIWVRAQASGSGGPEKFDFGQSGGTMSTGNAATRGAWGNVSLSLGALTDVQVDALNIDVVSSTIGGGETIQIADVWVDVTYTITCSDPDPPTLTISDPPEGAPISGIYRVKLQVTGELNPETFTNVQFSLNGAGYVAADGWDGSNWFIDWDTTLATDGAVTIDARGDDPDCGTTANATQRNATVNNSGPSSALTNCGSCHDYPPSDSATRGTPEGAVVGDHQAHLGYTCNFCHEVPLTEDNTSFGHRDEIIKMKFNTIGDAGSGDNGNYSRETGSGFAQSNTPTTGTCSNVECHYNNVTPQWGVGNTDCASCHGAPPNSNAHFAHFTAQGWTNPDTAGANCATCHPGDHDGIVEVNAALTYAANSCSTPGGLGCHNDYPTPDWTVGGAVCTDCHSAGGANAADPTTGLHSTTNLTNHDSTLTGGTGSPCEKCHTAAPSASHYDGTVDTPTVWNLTNIPGGYVANVGDGSDGCTASCHSDQATWQREWNSADDVAWNITQDASTTANCGNCHGSFTTGWNIVGNTSHVDPSAVNTPNALIDSRLDHGECSKCHGWGHANYTAGMHNIVATPVLHMNSLLSYDNANPDATCSVNCHSGDVLTMKSDSGWTDGSVAGDGVVCGDCHKGGVRPTAESGAHVAHGADRTDLVANLSTWPACIGCHPDVDYDIQDGSNGHNNGSFTFKTNLTYSAAQGLLTGTCSGTAGCHVATSNIAWDQTQAVVNDCSVCHVNTADVDDINGTNNSASMIDSNDYSGTGHGKAGVAKGCMNCHSTAVAHNFSNPIAGTNPFRLAGYGSDVNTFCSNEAAGCHTVSTGMLNHNQTNAGAKYTWTWTPNCTDCHDPHGDGTTFNNIKMVQQNPTDGASGSHGVGGATEATAVDFTTQGGIALGSYADTDGKGICQVCHTQAAGSGSFADGDTTPLGGSHPTSGLAPCTSCHTHDKGFKASGCSGCHGGGTTGVTAANYWPDASNVNPENDTPGGHLTHMTKLASKVYNQTITQLLSDLASPSDTKQKALCIYCHDANAGDHATALPAEVGPGKTATGAADNFSYSASTCATADCHNNKTTPVWTTTSSACTMCHASDGPVAGSIVNPTSGLHDPNPAPTTSGQAHNENLGTGCTGCHTTMTTSYPTLQNGSTHINGTNDSTAMAHLSLDANLNYDNTLNTCSGGSVAAGACHGIDPIDAGTWKRKWNNAISYASNGTTECAGCHGGFSADWAFGADNTTGDFNVSHDRNWDADANPSEVIGNHSGSTQTTKCNSCHVYGDTEYLWGTYHRDRKVTMNSTLGYSGTTFNCTTHCHSNNTGHNLEAASSANFATRGNSVAGPAMSCTTCHNGSGGGGLAVSSTSPHVIVGTKAGYNTFTSCDACHPQHTGGVLVPNEARVGISYTADGRTGFRLGGTATSGTTEAEICWNCHNNTTTYQTTAISEWGANNKQPGTPAAVTAYNWGTLTATPNGPGNWVGATWTSAQSTLFSYKTGTVQSTHAANFAATTPGADTVANIRCSYCHDMHDTYGTSGKPYLRGTWWTNPYLEDGAPQSSITYAGVAPFGNVPRAQASQNQLGGYQIDQNNGSPTATGGTGAGGAWTVADSAGLCWLCHNKNRAGTNVTVDTLDWFGTNDWATNGSGQINGHSNAVVGGTGSNRMNIFRSSWRAPSMGLTTTGARPDMGYANHGTGVGYGYRAVDARGFNGHSPPTNAGNSRPYGGGLYSWGATVNDTTTDVLYHKFSCSKCHNPHASRLPRLMVTNCLDTKKNTWDNVRAGITALSVTVSNDNGITLSSTTAPDSWGRTWSNVQSAQNCHRLADPAVNPTNTTNYGRGWNNVTPW